MNQSRIDLLEKFIQEAPSDPFNYYALALEYLQTQPWKAAELFDLILTNQSEYLPVYYTAGTFFADQGNEAKAQEILRKGIALAKRIANSKALGELQNALQNLDS